MDFLYLCAVAVLSVASLFVITKIMGHKQVGQLDFFDYVSGITIGSIGAELATELDAPWKPLVALLVWCSASLGLNFLTRVLPKTRKYINGTPTIIISDGIIFKENMKKARLDLSELLLLLREAGYFDIDDIAVAVFEYNGKISILPKSDKAPLTPSDLNIVTSPSHICTEVIMDGRVIGENLDRMNKTYSWLLEMLKSNGYSSPREILLALYKGDGSLSLFPKNVSAEKPKLQGGNV